MNTRPRVRAGVAALSVTALLTLSGCSLFGGDDAPEASASSSPTSSASESASPTPSESESSSASPSEDATESAEASAKAAAESEAAAKAAAESEAAAKAAAESEAAAKAAAESEAAAKAAAESEAAAKAAAESEAAQKECSGETAAEAVRNNAGKVREGLYPWAFDGYDDFAFDGCAALDVIPLNIYGGTGSSPTQLMFFHHGEYVGPGTPHDYAFAPSIERVDDATLRVTYRYARDGESNAAATGKAVSTFTWDEAKEKLVRTGDVPPGYEDMPEPEARSSAGGSADHGVVVDGNGTLSLSGTPSATPNLFTTGRGAVCQTSQSDVTCYSGNGMMATLPADGVPTDPEPIEGIGFNYIKGDVVLPPGGGHQVGQILCLASKTSLECTSLTTRSKIFATEDRMVVTP